MTKKNQAILRASLKLGLPYDYVLKVYRAYWKFNKQHIASLPLKQDITEEEYNKYKHSVSLPYLGKLYCTYERLQNKRKGYEESCSKGD